MDARRSSSSSSSSSSNGGIRKFRASIKALVLIISLGILMMWVMTPTITFRQKWRPKISDKVTSSFLETSGSTILIWTFPTLFIAVLGCLYLHLGKKLENSDEKRNEQTTTMLKKPILVKGPLGIVTCTELAFLLMFIALLVWSLSNHLHNKFATITPPPEGKVIWLYVKAVAFYLGIVGNIVLAFLFFPVARGSSVLPVIGLTSEGSIKYHIWMGHMVMALFTAHGFGYILSWIVNQQISKMFKWKKTDVSILAGEISLLGGLCLWITTLPRIRRKAFELFFYTHYLYIIFIVFFIFHIGIDSAFIMLPNFYLFLIDRYLRLLQSQKTVRLASARILPCNALELNFSKTQDLNYNPTSIMYVNVPTISKLQWHPFTITSSSILEPERISVAIKSEGNWSKKLYEIISSPNSIDRLQVAIEGPYGPASTHFLRHDKLVMVSGGSGITPFISIIRELFFLSKTSQRKIPKLTLICAFKNSSDLTWLDLLTPISDTNSSVHSNLELQIKAYITRDKAPSTADNSRHSRTVWFKPFPTDTPLSPILGPNSWLWLAAIILSSFVMFLILIGVVTRFYIYPIDHNKYEYSYSAKAALNMLFICVSIVATASGAVFLNRRSQAVFPNARELEEGQPPVEFWVENGDRELGNLPQPSILDGTNVHYGKRPDLKRMLLECEGSSVGVLAAGPKSLRHEMATICSSGPASRFHFESISFSW